jgi:hypothetical protein
MKVLFLVHNLGKTRHFDRVIQALTDRGHDVVVCAAHKRNKPLKLGDFRDNPHVDVVTNPVRRTDEWEPLVRPLRQARDYLRYLGPGYEHANKLAERARAYAPPGWPERLSADGPWRRRRKWLKLALETAESLVPSERYYELYLRSHAPDVVLVTPLIDFGSYQTDYVKSAHRLGLPVAFLPFSWDNLTNRGLVRTVPDRMLAWNETQKHEAITYHDVPGDRIVVTGAARFDDFFEMRPTSTREEFCGRAGLDPSRPFLIYLCSSRFVAPNEAAFVRDWVRTVRAATAPSVAACGVLVRPHPANADSWAGVNFDGVDNAAVWPERAKVQADPALFDGLYHSAAVAGLNTSAMIEAGILGKPVYTIQTTEFAGGQEQTLHFHYLLARNGGLVEVATTLPEHLSQIADGLADPDASRDRIRRFIKTFVRPRGLDRPVASILADEIEHVATIKKRPRRTPLWHYPARVVLRAALTRGFGRSPIPPPSQP